MFNLLNKELTIIIVFYLDYIFFDLDYLNNITIFKSDKDNIRQSKFVYTKTHFLCTRESITL